MTGRNTRADGSGCCTLSGKNDTLRVIAGQKDGDEDGGEWKARFTYLLCINEPDPA